MHGWTHDLRQGFKTLRLHPEFSAVAIATLALGIGASTAVFSLVERVLLRPLPFADPERLVKVWEVQPESDLDRMWVAPPNFLDWREQTRDVFSEMAAWQDGLSLNLTGEGDPERIEGTAVSAAFFEVLGVPPALGREFEIREAEEGRKVAMIGHDLWRRRFGGSPEIVGRTIRINDEDYSVTGVMPAGFRFPAGSEVWVPLAPERWDRPRTAHFLDVVARLAPGVSLERAGNAMDTVAARLAREYPETNENWGSTVRPLQEEITGDARPALAILLGAVGLLLLIACANVANLKLVRSVGREQEIAVRVALGADRSRLFRQLLLESLLLAGVAGLLGLALGAAGLGLLVSWSPVEIPRAAGSGLDLPLVGIALLVSAAAGLLFGLAPALHASRAGSEALRIGRSGSGAGRSGRRWRGALAVAEVALSLVLLVSAGLLVRSFERLTSVDPGFQPQGVLILRVSLPQTRYPEGRIAPFWALLLDRLEQVPGVRSAGATSALPLTEEAGGTVFVPEGRAAEAADRLLANYVFVSPGYFETIRASLVAGRAFSPHDREDAPPVVIVNRALARRFWPAGQAVGRRLGLGFGEREWHEIVGVVADIREEGLEVDQRPAMYLPVLQYPTRSMVVALQADSDPAALAPAARRAIWSLDPQQPVYGIQALEDHLSSVTARQRFSMFLMAAFATAALVLAALGIYSVTAFSVSARSHEIGIRMALGALPGQIGRQVVGRGLALTALGVVLGLAGALTTTHALSGLLFGVKAQDPATFAAVPLILLGVAALAAWLPARRAARMDPAAALRQE